MELKKIVKFQEHPLYRILWVSNSPQLKTGYGIVTRQICSRLSNDPQFEVFTRGFQQINPTHQFMNFVNLEIRPEIVLRGEIHRYWEIVYNDIINLKPHVVIFLEDGFTLEKMGMMNLAKLPVKKIHYKPIDGEVVETNAINFQRMMNLNIPMAEFGKKEMEKEGLLNVWTPIRHGIDFELFYPPNEEEQKKLKVKYGFKEDDVIFYNFSRHNMRKSDQSLVEALYIYFLNSKTPENHKAFLHILDYKNIDVGDLEDFCSRVMYKKYGRDLLKEGRIIFNQKALKRETMPDDVEMAEYMRMCDYVVSASSGEGEGIIMNEAMSAGKIVIHNAYTTPLEKLIFEYDGIGQRGFVVEPNTPFYSSFNTRHAHVDPETFANKILEAVNTPKEKIEEMKVNCVKFAERFLSWDLLAEEFKKAIKFVVG